MVLGIAAGHRPCVRCRLEQWVAEAWHSHPLALFSLHQPRCELGNSGGLAGGLGRLSWPGSVFVLEGAGSAIPLCVFAEGELTPGAHQAQQPQIPLFRLLLVSNERPCLGVMSACCEEDSCMHPMRNEFISLPTAPAKMPDFLGK